MTMNDLIREYRAWLEPQTGVQDQRRSYSDLLEKLWEKEFVWLVPWDDNRIADGLEIRKEFLREVGADINPLDLGPCSVLEVIIGLSRRLEFMAGGTPPGWAWQLITNLNLHKFADPIRGRKVDAVEEILNDLIWRNYDPDGMGGFFPLIDTDLDQRQVEIWYQLAAYIGEIHPEWG